MAFVLKTPEQMALDDTLSGIISAVVAGTVTLAQARYAISHIVVAAAKDNEAEVFEWLKPERVEAWKKECDSQGA